MSVTCPSLVSSIALVTTPACLNLDWAGELSRATPVHGRERFFELGRSLRRPCTAASTMLPASVLHDLHVSAIPRPPRARGGTCSRVSSPDCNASAGRRRVQIGHPYRLEYRLIRLSAEAPVANKRSFNDAIGGPRSYDFRYNHIGDEQRVNRPVPHKEKRGNIYRMERTGIEPVTPCLQSRCSPS
jgi:hypothetical protein